MFDTLQSLYAVPVINEPKIEPVGKPAVIIPINTDMKNLSPEAKASQQLPFEKWTLPAQEEGYIRGKRSDFL